MRAGICSFARAVAMIALAACPAAAAGDGNSQGDSEPQASTAAGVQEATAGRPVQGPEESAHAFLRAQGGVHGEVTVYRSREIRKVETLLYSRVLKRVVAEIVVREADAWPAGRAGAEDSRTYVEALTRAQKKVWWESARDPAAHGRIQEMAIVFETGPDGARVSLFAVRTRPGPDGRRRIVDRTLLEEVAVSRDYALRDQRLIVEDAFGLDAQGAAALLAGDAKP